MKTLKLKCQNCGGTGRWQSPAVKTLEGKILPAQSLQCLSCEGRKVVTAVIEDPHKSLITSRDGAPSSTG